MRYSAIRLRDPLIVKHTSVDRIDVTVAKLRIDDQLFRQRKRSGRIKRSRRRECSRPMVRPLHDDLALLELRPRRGHDLRRTFITLAQVDGARKDILEAISHGARGDIVSV